MFDNSSQTPSKSYRDSSTQAGYKSFRSTSTCTSLDDQIITKDESSQYREIDFNGYDYLSSPSANKSLELICEEDKEEDDDEMI